VNSFLNIFRYFKLFTSLHLNPVPGSVSLQIFTPLHFNLKYLLINNSHTFQIPLLSAQIPTMQGNVALIGYSGFVGRSLMSQINFTHVYRSTDAHEIRGGVFDLVICAGAPAEKWIANKEPQQDKAVLMELEDHLLTVSAKCFILISTIDVYAKSDSQVPWYPRYTGVPGYLGAVVSGYPGSTLVPE
jgi:hypothetical protein